MYRTNSNDGIAWVTGASTGIGKETVLELIKSGYTVAVSSRDKQKLNELANLHEKIFVFPCDVTDNEQVRITIDEIEKIGPINFAFLNAGGFFSSNSNMLGSDFKDTMNLNLNGTINCLEHIIPKMMNRKKGHIAVMSSVSGYCSLPFFSDGYVLSKSTLIRLCEIIKPKLNHKNIRIQVICPSFINTDLLSKKVFNMPFMVDVDKAAKIIVKGFKSGEFEIFFPKITGYWLKFINIMPYPIFFLLNRITMFFIRK